MKIVYYRECFGRPKTPCAAYVSRIRIETIKTHEGQIELVAVADPESGASIEVNLGPSVDPDLLLNDPIDFRHYQ